MDLAKVYLYVGAASYLCASARLCIWEHVGACGRMWEHVGGCTNVRTRTSLNDSFLGLALDLEAEGSRIASPVVKMLDPV